MKKYRIVYKELDENDPHNQENWPNVLEAQRKEREKKKKEVGRVINSDEGKNVKDVEY